MGSKIWLIFYSIIFLLLSISFTQIWAEEGDEADKDIIIVKSQATTSFNEAVEGLRDGFSKNGIASEVYEYALIDRKTKARMDFDELLEKHPVETIRAFFLVGNSASEKALEDPRLKEVPKVILMVVNPVEKGMIESLTNPGKNVAGVTFDVSTEDQISLIKLLIPKLKRVGIIYSGKSTNIVSKLTQELNTLEIFLDSQFVESPEEVISVFPKIAENIHIFMLILDPNIYNATVIKYFIEQSSEYPICGLTSTHANLGLLCSVSTDFYSQGAQAIDVFLKLEKESYNIIEHPELVKIFVNEKTAEKLNITIPHSSKIMLLK